MKILKFGGTSVGSANMMKQVASLVMNKEKKVVVLSAMSGTTNILEEIGRFIKDKKNKNALLLAKNLKEKYVKTVSELFPKKKDEVNKEVSFYFNRLNKLIEEEYSKERQKDILSVGELVTSKMFYFYLAEQGADVALLPALKFMKIDNDGEPDADAIKKNIIPILQENKATVYVTQGFICKNPSDKIDNLKRGGSDYSASLIGQAIAADEIQIWTDISGIHNNDPRYVDETQPISNLSFEEAEELAYFGAKILHPTSILPAKKSDIPVLLKNTMEPKHEGTRIFHTSEEKTIKAIAAKDNITAIKIRSGHMLLAYGFLSEVFDIFKVHKTPIDMITTSEVAVSLTIDDDTHLPEIVEKLKKYGKVEVDKDQVIVCIVGNLISKSKGVAAKIFSGLKGIPLRMISYGGSHHNVSVLINKEDKVKALNLLSKNLLNN